VAGVESASLYNLAGLSQHTRHDEAGEWFEAAAREVHLPLLSDGHGADQISILILELVVDGSLSPHEGGGLLYLVAQERDLFSEICILASIFDEYPEQQEEFSAVILRDAESILAERLFVGRAIAVWDGPAAVNLSLLQILGFSGIADFHGWRRAIIAALRDRRITAPADRPRILRLVDVAIHDDINGAGWEWPTVTPYTLGESEALLVSLGRRYDLPPVQHCAG